MKIPVASLDEGENQVEADLTAEELGFSGEIIPRGPFHVDLSLYRQGKAVEIRGSAQGTIVDECSRCLGPAELQIDAKFMILADERGRNAGDELPDDDPEIFFVHYQHGMLELDAPIREAILLDRPIQTLCMPDCRGLCPRCGANLNTEPCRCGDPPAQGGEPPAQGS